MLWSVRFVDYFTQLMKLEICQPCKYKCWGMGGFEYIVERGFACGGGNCSTGS
jgi:hypothetical protein